MDQHFLHIVRVIEEELAEFYGFELAISASDHVISRAELKSSLGKTAVEKSDFSARAGVWLFSNEEREEVFIGIHFAKALKEDLVRRDPLKLLDNSNLDLFCVVVEEISHFHLLLNRLHSGDFVSRLELEWQGEIDKLVMCGLMLANQCGDAHLLPLVRVLFDHSTITADYEEDRYWQATKYAARFWYDLLARNRDAAALLYAPWMRRYLRELYRDSWHGKMKKMEAESIPAAS